MNKIYTDGMSAPNPGKGAWAFVLDASSGPIVKTGTNEETTNNRMEMTAVLEAIRWHKKTFGDVPFEVYSDSQYVVNGCNNWLWGWLYKGVLHKKKNPDIWKELAIELGKKGDIHMTWVRGHDGIPMNELADQSCTDSYVKAFGEVPWSPFC